MQLSIEKKTNSTLFNNLVWLSQKLSDKRQKETAAEKMNSYLYYNVNLDIICVLNNYETRILRGINSIPLFTEVQAQCSNHHILFTYMRQRSTILLPIVQDYNLCVDIESHITKLVDLIGADSFCSEDSYYDGSEQGYAKLVAKTLRMMPPDCTFNFLSMADLPSDYYTIRCGENGPLVLDSSTRTLVQACIKIADFKYGWKNRKWICVG